MNISHKENEVLNPFGNKANTPNLEALLKSPTDILSPASSTYGSPKPGTSRVIDALQTTIDTLKSELSDIKSKYEDEKQKAINSKKKYDQVLDQLATSKHENDMNNALLERKQRRVLDLENKLSDQISSSEDYKFNLDKLETRCKKLSESEKIANSEFERMKIAYETLVTSQKEYKDYCSKEIDSLREQLQSYINERDQSLEETKIKIEDNNMDIENNLNNLNEALYSLENQYSEKNSLLVSTLKSLTLAAKSHGQDTQLVINQCNLVFNELKNQFNLDVNKLIENYKDTHIDSTIEKLLNIEPITSPKNEYNSSRNTRRLSSYNTEKRKSVSGINGGGSQNSKKSNNSKRQSMIDFSEFTNNNNNNRINNKQKRNSSYSTPNTPLLSNNNHGTFAVSSFSGGNYAGNSIGNSSFNNSMNDSFSEIMESGSESDPDASTVSANTAEKKKKNRRRRRRGGANKSNNGNKQQGASHNE